MTGADDPLGWQGATLDDRVKVEEVVGEGGFGLVYRGHHVGFRETVAVKCLKIPPQLNQRERDALMDQFREEARILHRLSRKTAGIVQALDVGAAVSPSGIWTPYIVMEWLEGHTLEHEMQARARQGEARYAPADAVALLEPAALALGVAHAAGVSHLDVKPGNLFVTADEDGRTLKVLDFGIARVLSSNRTLTRALTQQGREPAFTPGYAAPEQYHKRHGNPGPASDVFSLALVLLELCSGQPALYGDTPLQLYIAAANELLRPSFAAVDVPANSLLERALARALEVDPAQRFADAGRLWEAFAEAIELETEATSVRRPNVQITVVSAGVAGTPTHTTAVTQSAVLPTAASGAQRRVCTVVVAELGGAHAAARHLDPEAVAALVERSMEQLGRALEDAGGVIEQHLGDAVVASFGLRSDSASAAERAVDAALRLERALGEPSTSKRALRHSLRIGIDTGRVYSRPGTRSTTSGPVIVGAPASFAIRIARAAPAGAVFIGRDTYRQVAGLFDHEPIALPAADGEDVAHAYRVRGRVRGERALQLLAERDFLGRPTALVGRAAEMEALGAVADAALRGPAARLVALLGPAGIGKSRLLHELALKLEADGFALFAARSSPLGQRTSYALAAALLRARFHVHEDDPPETAEDKLIRGIRALHETGGATTDRQTAPFQMSGVQLGSLDTSEIAAQLLRVLGYAAPRSSGEALGTDARTAPVKQRIAAAFAALAGAARRPVAVLCDDVHTADEASLDLFDDLLVRLGATPVVFICAAQPSLLERRPRWSEAATQRQALTIGALPRRHLEDMARDRLSRLKELPADLVALLAERAEGSPLTLVETLHLLIDAGAVDPSSEPWQLREQRVSELQLPTTVQGIVQARLDRLDARSLDLVCKAAVIGPVFWDGALAEMDVGPAADRAPVVAALDLVAERGLVRPRPVTTFPGEREYAFAETALSEVAYEMLPQAERRELHRRVAAWLERHLAGHATTAMLARHHERAAALDEALRAYARAGRHAASLGQNAEALHCYERACRLDDWMSGDRESVGTTGEAYLFWDAPDDARVASWPDRVRLRVELGDVLRRMGRLDEAEARYEQARAHIVRTEAIDEREPVRWEARVDFRLAQLKDMRGDLAEARALLARAIAKSERAELSEERAQMFAHLGGLHLRSKDTAASLQASIAGLRLCRALTRRGERWREAVAWLLRTLGGVFYHRGRMVRAERCYLQSARLLDEAAQPLELARVLNNVAAARFARGDAAAARDAFRRAFELARRSGDLWVTMTALGNLGEVEHALGHSEAARDCLEEAVRLGEAMGAGADVAEFHRNLALVRLALGAHEPSVASARRALELARREARVYLAAVVETAIAVCCGVAGTPARASGGALASSISMLLSMASPSNQCTKLSSPTWNCAGPL